MKAIARVNNVNILLSDNLVLMSHITEALGLDTEYHVSQLHFVSIIPEKIDITVFGTNGNKTTLSFLPVKVAIDWLNLLNEMEICCGNCTDFDSCEIDKTKLHHKEFYCSLWYIIEELEKELYKSYNKKGVAR